MLKYAIIYFNNSKLYSMIFYSRHLTPVIINHKRMTESNSLVPSLLNSIEVKNGKTRPTVQAHPHWELMRVK
jgi:hypothetical protein